MKTEFKKSSDLLRRVLEAKTGCRFSKTVALFLLMLDRIHTSVRGERKKKLCFLRRTTASAAQRGCSEQGLMVGSIAVTDADCRGGCTVTSVVGDSGKQDARMSAGSIVHRNAPDFCRVTQSSSVRPRLLLLSPNRIRNMRRLLHREKVDVLFYCIRVETCSIINRGHLWPCE